MHHDVTSYYPVFLDLRGRRCLVVGGGEVAMRKVTGLLAAGASITVVSPLMLEMPASVQTARRPFLPSDLDGAAFVIAATDDRAVNALVAEECARRGIWANVVDTPAESSVILPAVVRRGEFCLAISTGGASPSLARRLRERLEEEFGEEYATLVALLGELRRHWEPRLNAAGVSAQARRELWERVVDLPLADLLRAGHIDDARRRAEALLASALSPREA